MGVLHVVEWDVAVAEGWGWDDVCVESGTFAHVQLKLFHFLDCAMLGVICGCSHVEDTHSQMEESDPGIGS
jgi:hypothetical protein